MHNQMLSRISQFDDSSAEIRARHDHSRHILGNVNVAMKRLTSCLPRVWPDVPSNEFATMWKCVEYLQIRRRWKACPSDSLAPRWIRWVLEVWIQLSVRDGQHTTRRFRRPATNPGKTKNPRNETSCERTSTFCQHELMAVGTVAWYAQTCSASLWFPTGGTESA